MRHSALRVLPEMRRIFKKIFYSIVLEGNIVDESNMAESAKWCNTCV